MKNLLAVLIAVALLPFAANANETKKEEHDKAAEHHHKAAEHHHEAAKHEVEAAK